MIKRTLNILVLSLALSLNATGQSDTSFQYIKTIQGDIVDFTVDNLDNIYILSSRNQVKKLNANGDSVAIFNDVKKFGKAAFIDVSNPLKLLLYYKDFSTIVILDRFLNIRSSIDLRKQNIFGVKAIGLSYDNKIWLYDELDNKLKKIDEDGKMLRETSDFRTLFGEAPAPQKIFDENQFVYLYDSAQAVFVFDYYGALKNKILISGWQNFRVAGKYIFGTSDNILHRYEISSFRLDEWKMPEPISQSLSFHFTTNRLYVLKKNVIEIYSFR
jgi:hypothetical protein